MKAKVYGFDSPESFDRMVRAVRDAERVTRASEFQGPHLHTGPVTDVTVRVSSATPTVVNGRKVYPGWFVFRNPGTSAETEGFDTWINSEPCWVAGSNNEELFYDCVYVGRVIERYEDESLVGVTAGRHACRCTEEPDDVEGHTSGIAPEFTITVPTIQDPNAKEQYGFLGGRKFPLRYAGTGFYKYLSGGPWILEISNTVATLTGTGKNGEEVVFRNSSFDATAEDTLTFVSADPQWDTAIVEIQIKPTGEKKDEETCTNPDGTPGGASPCQGLGWLQDREALKLKAFAVTFLEGLDRCACIDLTQGDDPEGTRFLLVYDAVQDLWVPTKGNETCCGCGEMTLDLSTSETDPLDHLPDLVVNINRSCKTPSEFGPQNVSFTSRLRVECGGDGYAVFAGWGEDSCSDPPGCKNLYRVKLECTTCAIPNVACVNCNEGQGPPVWRINATGFADPSSYAKYNGRWYLKNTGTCTWSQTCQATGVTITLAITCTSGIVKGTLTFSGDGATAVYEYSASAGVGLVCTGGFNSSTALVRITGSMSDTPATISAFPVGCDTACDVSLTVTASAVVCGVDWTSPDVMTDAGGYLTKSAGGGSTDPECDTGGGPNRNSCKGLGVIVKCESDGTFSVGPYCGPVGCDDGMVCYAGPPGVITGIVNTADPPDVLFSVTVTITDPDCDETISPLEVTFTFESP